MMNYRLLLIMLDILFAAAAVLCSCAAASETPAASAGSGAAVSPASAPSGGETADTDDEILTREDAVTPLTEAENAKAEDGSGLQLTDLVYTDPERYSKYLDRAIEYAETIRGLYWDGGTCLSKLTPEGGVPYLWPFTEQSAMVNGILMAMDKDHPKRAYFEEYLRELIEGLRHYRVRRVNMGDGESWNDPFYQIAGFGQSDGTPHSYAIYCASRANKKIDNVVAKPDSVYFDDNVWVAKTFYYAWVNTGDEAYLREAANIMNWILGEGYETAGALNGIYWKWSSKFRFKENGGDSESASLNTCSTASSAMLLADLVPALQGTGLEGLSDSYLAASISIFDFCTEVFVDRSNGCLYDKVMLSRDFASKTSLKDQIRHTDKSQYAYNTGTYMTAGARLYSLLKENDPEKAEAVLSAALRSAKGADTYFADRSVKPGEYSYPSHSWFTSFLVSGFADLAAYDALCAEYEDHMRSSLDYAWEHNRSADGLVCPAWIKGWSRFAGKNDVSEDNPRQILYQSANANCLAMLARFYR